MKPALIEHSLTRTLSDMDNSWYTLLTMNTAPHYDLEYGRATEFGRTLMNSTLTLAVALNIVANDCHGAPIEIDRCDLKAPMFGGDTLRLTSSIESPADDGTVRIRSVGANQEGTVVIELEQRMMPGGVDDLLAAAVARSGAALEPGSEAAFTTPTIAPAFDDFSVGDRYDHGAGRTILADEAIQLALTSLNRSPLYFDRHLARSKGLPDVMVDPGLLFAITLGLSVRHTTQRSVANLGWRGARLHEPVHPGDTLYAETEVVGARRSATRPDRGIVTVRTLGRNQRGQVATSFQRAFLIQDRASRENPAIRS